MRRVLVIGIGAGDPEQVTVQAIRAINRADVVFVTEKGSEADELARVRREILARYREDGREPRVVALADPPRDRTASAYREAVDDWRHRRADLWERALVDELAGGQTGAFLVWGDPAIYDSTIAVLEEILARGRVALDYEVIPGISSIQALAARHRIPWARVGGAVQITTGRRLAAGLSQETDDVLVMLDSGCAFSTVAAEDVEIYWGAYVGTDDEILVSGRVHEVAAEIERRRRDARERKGWIMDSYLLRRPPTTAPRAR
ncbi:MAG TPA: precorrin-6A synthase (deacetylating) [Solirubrobacteraceae bacterium]|nr:precorrin-6A synthase (deacetylating) [Solirubrobacteraceae bacterium]